MQQAYRCGSTCGHDATWSQNLASLFHSGFILFPRFKLMFHSMYAPEIEHGTRKWTPGDPLQVKSCQSCLSNSLSFSTVYSLHCITVLPKDLDIPSATHQVFIARVLPVSVNDSLVIKIGDAANLGLWNAENSDNCQPPTTNSCRKCSEAARNNVKLWDIQPIDPSMVNIYSWLCVFASIFAIECISMKVFKSTTMQRDGHVACHGVLPHICSTWTSPSNHIAFN